MNWQQALDTQMDLLKWHNQPIGQRYTDAFFNLTLMKAGVTKADVVISDSSILERNVRTSLWRADTMYVTEDMQHLLLQAAHDLPDDAVFDPHILLCPIGFVQLEHAIHGEDASGLTIGTSAILWHESPLLIGEEDGVPKKAVFLYFFTDTNDPDDEINPLIVPGMKNLHIPVPPLALVHFFPMVEGERVVISDKPGSELVTGLCKFFMAMNIIAHQSIGEPVKLRPDRGTRRRMQRIYENAPERMITLITLRRKSVKKEDNGDKEPVPWTRRWVVRGHWRKQWYPSIKRHGWKYIYEYIKGPEDKPLIITERRVFNFRR